MRRGRATLVALGCLALLAGAARADRLEDAEAAVPERRYADAAEIWSERALSGNGEAQYRLGSLYRAGRGVPRDDAKAVAWLRRAAAVGHAEAQYGLASMIEDAPVTLTLNKQVWSPRNYDKRIHGSVPLVRALGDSLNLAPVQSPDARTMVQSPRNLRGRQSSNSRHLQSSCAWTT